MLLLIEPEESQDHDGLYVFYLLDFKLESQTTILEDKSILTLMWDNEKEMKTL